MTQITAGTDWDADGIPNWEDAYVLDPTNTIGQPGPQTVNFIEALKKHNQGASLLQTYSQLNISLATVDRNPDYFQDVTPLAAHVTARLVDGIPAIGKYPRALSLAIIEAEKQGLTDDGIVTDYVIPAVQYKVQLQEQGSITALTGLNIGDRTLEDMSIRQVLLPPELRMINIKTGRWYGSGVNYQAKEEDKTKIGIFNVTPNPDVNGLTPLEWLRNMATQDYRKKGDLYATATYIGSYPSANAWPDCSVIFDERAKPLLDEDDAVIFLQGYPNAILDPKLHLIPMEGQSAPYYSVIVAGLFGRPAFVVTANYPYPPNYPPGKEWPAFDGREGWHDDVYVLTKGGDFFGLWLDRGDFVKAYEGKQNRPILEGPDGYRPFQL